MHRPQIWVTTALSEVEMVGGGADPSPIMTAALRHPTVFF